MIMKKIYHAPSNDGEFRVVSGIEMKRLPKNGIQHFTQKLVDMGIGEGWLKITPSTITITDTSNKKHKFTIEVPPGKYCLHCDEKLSDDAQGTQARLHVEQEHSEADPLGDGGSGYMAINYYVCKF